MNIFSFISGLLIGIGIMTFYYNDGYKKGQIDALTDKIKYELITQSDSTKIWIEKGNK